MSLSPKTEFTYCPQCRLKGVHFRMRPNGEDHYRCRHCKWYFFTLGRSQTDKDNEAKWLQLNPQKRFTPDLEPPL